MWVLNAIVLIVFHEASGLDNRIESFPSTSPEKMKSCPMLTSFDNGWTCSVTQQFVDKGGNRLGDGSTCKSIKDSSLPPFKCSDGIWKRVRVKRAMTNHFSSCPSNQYLQPSPGKICAVATWTPPREEVDRHSGGNPGDCFTAGDHEITYQYDGFWTWNWVSGDTCTFTIHVSVSYCQSPPALQNGHLSCTGEVNNVFGSVCSHHCNPGYILQGNPDVRCDSSWNTNFPTCAESCSWPKNHCWPGDCRNQLAVNCVCRPGFTKVQINGGNRCELNTPPNLNTCRVSVRSGSGEVTESKFVGNITSCENQRNEIIKSTPSELSFTMKADLNWTLVSFATYVSSSSVGVVGAKITLVKISVSGIEQIIHEQSLNDYSTNCRQNVNDTVPLPSNLQLDCDGTIQLPTYHLGDGESQSLEPIPRLMKELLRMMPGALILCSVGHSGRQLQHDVTTVGAE